MKSDGNHGSRELKRVCDSRMTHPKTIGIEKPNRMYHYDDLIYCYL